MLVLFRLAVDVVDDFQDQLLLRSVKTHALSSIDGRYCWNAISGGGKVTVPPPRTSRKLSIRIRTKPGAASRTPETVLLLHVETAGVSSGQMKQH